MKCFQHRISDAIGVCRQCGKGLCEECAVDLEHSLCCKGACAEAAVALNLLAQNARFTYATQKRNKMFLPAFLFIMGAIFIIAGFEHGFRFSIMPLVLGAGFMIFGLVLFLINRKWAKGIVTGE